jgi:ABC-2 type transport system ATP-binding protein
MVQPLMPVGEMAIVCQGLTRHYGEVIAVEDLDLVVPSGSIFGFLGRNGAGKTTTIRMLTGLTHPTRGQAWVAGVLTTDANSAARRTFGYLPQAPAFYGWMTPLDYLGYCARIFAMSAAETRQRIDEMLNLVGLFDARRRRIAGFSGGMIQRMGIAQAMLHQPPVLLLDEPTSALDPAGRYEVLDLVARLRGTVTVFLSSHILADIERVCDHVAIIRSGRLVLVAEQDELMNRYTAHKAFFEFIAPEPEQIAGLLAHLQSLPWVASVQVEQDSLQVAVHDMAQARQLLLPLVLESGLVIGKFEWQRPTLEEIFLKLSA